MMDKVEAWITANWDKWTFRIGFTISVTAALIGIFLGLFSKTPH